MEIKQICSKEDNVDNHSNICKENIKITKNDIVY